MNRYEHVDKNKFIYVNRLYGIGYNLSCDIALVSEESPDDRQRLAKDFFWCIDPLDGTLPFIESLPGYSVSIALVSQAGVSLIGVVYDPLSQNLYYAIKGQGAWLNHQSLIKPPTPVFNQQALVFITDKSFLDDTRYQATSLGLQQIALELGFSSVELRLQGGAAMNACQALTLPACSYFKWPKAQIGGGSIWDYAASVCIYQEIGAFASASNGEPLVLNPHGSTFMNHCGILYCANNQLAEKMILLHEKLQVSAG